MTNKDFWPRLLTGGLVALIVARCLVAGDDPGRLRLTTGGGTLLLNLLTFTLLTIWALARGINRQPLERGWALVVPAALAAIAVLIFMSAMPPGRYAHPGWYIAWNWLAFAALAFLTSQLAVSSSVRRYMAAVLLATAASLGAQALYQCAENMVAPPGPPPIDFSALVGGDDTDGGSIATSGNVRGTFASAGALLIFIFLLLPTAIYWALRGWRSNRGKQAALVCLLLVLGAAAAVNSITDLGLTTMGPVLHVLPDGQLFGCGPGNRSRALPGSTPQAGYWISLGVECGPIVLGIALATVLLAIGAAFFSGRCAIDEAADTGPGPRLVFYGGGLAGLFLGFILAIGDIPAEAPAEAVLQMGLLAAVRGVVWFLGFALLEKVALSDRGIRCSLGIGLAIAVGAGFLTPALASLAILQTLWIVAELASPPARAKAGARSGLSAAWSTAPIALSLLTANMLHVGWPGLSTTMSVRTARRASVHFSYSKWQIVGKSGEERVEATADARSFLESNILQPLLGALQYDGENSDLLLETARWSRSDWLYRMESGDHQTARRQALDMLAMAEKAARIDPDNPAAPVSVFESVLLFTSVNRSASKEQLASLNKYIDIIAARHPEQEVELRYRVAMALMQRRNAEALDGWSVQLLELDAATTHGRLTEEERSALINGLRAAIAKPSEKLIGYLK